MNDPMITKTPLDMLYINSKLENYTQPLIYAENGYRPTAVNEYSLSIYFPTGISFEMYSPILETSMTLYSLSANASTDTSKIHYDESDISINVTNGEYYQTDFNSTWIIVGSTPSYQINDSSGSNQNWVSIDPSGPTLIIDTSSNNFISGGYLFQIHTLYDTQVFTQNLTVIVKSCSISNWNHCQSETVCKECIDGYQLSSDTWIVNSTTTNTTNHTTEEEQLEENVGVAMQVIVITNSIAMTATAIASLSPPQGLWLSINQQQMVLLMLLTQAYFPK